MIIRRETPEDVDAIRDVTAAAFATPDGGPAAEVPLIDELRESDAWLPTLSLVAVDASGEVIGHVLCTRGRVDDVPALGLGPLSVRPDRQRAGVGLALMHAVLGAAEASGEPLVALLGDPAYYSRFGFRASTDHRISPPVREWGTYFQVRTLADHDSDTRGTFTYAEPFARVS